jgi:hypothetical protein
MATHPAFESTENRFLLVIGARKTMRNAGTIGVIWGVLNFGIGIVAMKYNAINGGMVLLGVIMLTAGIYTLLRPSLNTLLVEALVSALLFAWNVGIAFLNGMSGHASQPNLHGLIFPLIAAVALFNQYRKLGHLKEAISAMDPLAVKKATSACKEMFREKLKAKNDIVEASSKRCRVRLLGDRVFCAQRNLNRAFHMDLPTFRACITNPAGKKLQFSVNHPLGTVRYDKKNSEILKSWFGGVASGVSAT